MKRILRHFVIDTFSLYVVSTLAEGMSLGNGYLTLISAGAAITIVSVIAKPVINLLLLPINLITFGLFRWVASSFILYITSLIVPSFKIVQFYFEGVSSKWIDIPEISFTGLLAYVCFSFILSVLTSFIYWLIK